jgi:hypothetical protein
MNTETQTELEPEKEPQTELEPEKEPEPQSKKTTIDMINDCFRITYKYSEILKYIFTIKAYSKYKETKEFVYVALYVGSLNEKIKVVASKAKERLGAKFINITDYYKDYNKLTVFNCYFYDIEDTIVKFSRYIKILEDMINKYKPT